MIKKFLFLVLCVTVLSASDTVTIGGLQWQDNSDAKHIQRDWQGAIEYCKNLSLAGKDDWRLPSIKELQSIIDIHRFKPAIKSSFKNVASNGYWSYSANVFPNSEQAWLVFFYGGSTNHSSTSTEYYVRCVRDR